MTLGFRRREVDCFQRPLRVVDRRISLRARTCKFRSVKKSISASCRAPLPTSRFVARLTLTNRFRRHAGLAQFSEIRHSKRSRRGAASVVVPCALKCSVPIVEQDTDSAVSSATSVIQDSQIWLSVAIEVVNRNQCWQMPHRIIPRRESGGLAYRRHKQEECGDHDRVEELRRAMFLSACSYLYPSIATANFPATCVTDILQACRSDSNRDDCRAMMQPPRLWQCASRSRLRHKNGHLLSSERPRDSKIPDLAGRLPCPFDMERPWCSARSTDVEVRGH